MRKMAKPRKAAKPRRAPDQLRLKTGCELCGKLFPDPTAAAYHVAEEHAR